MEENNSNFLYYADVSSVVIESLKDNPKASKNNDFAISTDTSRRPVTIQISLGKGMEKIRSTIEKKLKAGEFVIRKDEDLEDELCFVFFKKDLKKQPTDNNVKDVLFLPTVKILEALNESKKEKDAVYIAYLVHGYISNFNKSMDWTQKIGWEQKILDLYNGKNNENNNITNKNIDLNNNINPENNNINVNNNLNNDIFEENKEIKNENNNSININKNNDIDNNNNNINENGNENNNENKDNKEEKDENENNEEENKSKGEDNNNENGNINENGNENKDSTEIKNNNENTNNNEDNKEEKDENNNNNINESIDFNNNINKENRKEYENSNIFNENIGFNNLIINNNPNNNIINQEGNNQLNNLNDNINPDNNSNNKELQEKPNNENTVSLFGLGCCSIQSDKRNDHCCGGCFW